jgi:hypothetical protein
MNPEAENHYQELKGFLKGQSGKFTNSELGTLYAYLKNYCIDYKIREGRQDYFQELFDLVQTLQEKGVLLENGALDSRDYEYIVKAGLKAEAFEWVENFIREYGEKEAESSKAIAGSYNIAKLYFQQGKFEKVVDQLREMKYKRSAKALEGKLMLLKTYYELEEQLLMNSLIESLRIYLRHNRRISKAAKEKYLNLLKFVGELSKVLPGDKEAAKGLRRQIERTKALTDKPWLLEKVEELKG